MNSEKNASNPGALEYAAYLPQIDVAEGIRRVMHNKKMYFKLLKRFDVKQMTQQLIDSIKDADFAAIKSNAHTLKGVAANLALIEIRNLAVDIEQMARRKEPCDNMAGVVLEASQRLSQTVETLLRKEDSNES